MIDIPGYTVQRLLGHGGMATVYLAQQKSLGRDVALKVLTPALASDPVATERFLREARVSAKLHHPNIVAIFDVGVHEGVPYMSIAYEPGGTVAGYAQAKNDPKVALRILRDIANALDYAHRQGVIHRDVKPENILLRADGTCVLSDFGIAHAIGGAQSGLTREGTSVGTPHYMSPEQLRGEHVDARADIYSLGVVLYQLLTGELPYQGTDGWAIGMQHIGAPIPQLPPHLDHLQTFLDALLAKNPDNRLQSGAEVVHWINARLSSQGPAMTVAMPSPMTAFNTTPSGARGAASIAILPFADLSQTKDQEYLADGLTEELCNLLAKVPGLFVASRSAAARFKGSTAKLAEIGRELKVATVLEGSVRKFGERVRISVQLINVSDGFQRWSETYDRTLTDVFAIQDEIAALVLAALKEQLLPNVEAEAAKKAAKAAEEKAAAAAREREAAELAAREEIEKQDAEERRQREIHERIMQKKREREEAERLAAEKKVQDEAERVRREAEEREAAKQREIEERAAAARRAEQEREDAARREREAAERAEAERLAAERAEVERVEAAKRAEVERLAAEKAAAARAAQEAAEREQQRVRDEEAQRAEAERRRAEETRLAEERRQREEAELAAALEAKREAEARAAAEREVAAKRADEAARAEAEQREAERAEAAKREAERAEAAKREAAQRAEAAELQRRADEARAKTERDAAEVQLRADEARVAAERATLVTPPAAAVAAAAASADAAGAEPERDPARDFASAYMSKPAGGGDRPPPPKSAAVPSSLPVAKIGMAAGVLLVLAVGGWLFMNNQKQKNDLACQAALLQGQTDLDAGDFDKAATSALAAHGTCSGASETTLAALDTKIQNGKRLAQTCGAGTTQAREFMRAGKPKAAAAAMAPLHDSCAGFPGFPELEALPANAQAQAAQLVQQIEPLMKSRDYEGAQALAVQVAAIDAEAPGLADLRARLDKQLGTTTPAVPAPAPAPAPAPPVAPPPKPAAPTTDAAATAAAKAAADKLAKEREAKLAEERTRREQQRAAAAAAAAAARPTAPAAVPVAPAPAPAPTPSAPAPRNNALVATSTPQPPYPPQALRGKVSGEVTVSFTVNTDGSVGGVRIVSARPRGTFDRGVLAAVGRWRFKPVDEPQTVTRTITFTP